MEDERIDALRQLLGARRCRLNPPLDEDAIAEFERRYGIQLPAAYRTFLLVMGNGGKGPPEDGVVRLGEVPEYMSSEEQAIWGDLGRLSKPFPFTGPWVWEDEENSAEGSHEQVAWGSLRLGNDGCGQYWHLIVTGAERGHIWMFTGEGIVPTVPRRDFVSWYTDWLRGVDDWWG